MQNNHKMDETKSQTEDPCKSCLLFPVTFRLEMLIPNGHIRKVSAAFNNKQTYLNTNPIQELNMSTKTKLANADEHRKT